MGGFGTAKCAFNCPEKYGAAAMMSTGPMSPKQAWEEFRGGVETEEFKAIFGGFDQIPGSINDLWHILEQNVRNGVDMPLIYDCCGQGDFGYPKFCEFKALTEKLGLNFTFAEGSGGHDWDFWNEYLPKIIDWLPLKHRNVSLKAN